MKDELKYEITTLKSDLMIREHQMKSDFNESISNYQESVDDLNRSIDRLSSDISNKLEAQNTSIKITIFWTAVACVVGLLAILFTVDEFQDTAFSSGYGARESLGEEILATQRTEAINQVMNIDQLISINRQLIEIKQRELENLK